MVVGIVAQAMGQDDLAIAIDSGLRVVGLDKPVASIMRWLSGLVKLRCVVGLGLSGGCSGLRPPRYRCGAAAFASAAALASASSSALAVRIRANRFCLSRIQSGG